MAAAATYLAGRDDVEPGRIGAWGFSLGGLVAIQAAGETDLIRAIVAAHGVPWRGPRFGLFPGSVLECGLAKDDVAQKAGGSSL